MERPKIGEFTDAEAVRFNWREDLKLIENYDDHEDELVEILSECKDIWDLHVAVIGSIKHWIDLTFAGCLTYAFGSSLVWTTRSPVRTRRIQKNATKTAIESAKSQLVAHTVFARKKDGALFICLNYRKLDAVTVRDSYPLPRMDKYVNSFGDAGVILTVGANSGYRQARVGEEDIDKLYLRSITKYTVPSA